MPQASAAVVNQMAERYQNDLQERYTCQLSPKKRSCLGADGMRFLPTAMMRALASFREVGLRMKKNLHVHPTRCI